MHFHMLIGEGLNALKAYANQFSENKTGLKSGRAT